VFAWGSPKKSLDYRMTKAPPHSAQILAINPFGRIPVFRDGDVALYNE
jgi:glutathione S-transferase